MGMVRELEQGLLCTPLIPDSYLAIITALREGEGVLGGECCSVTEAI